MDDPRIGVPYPWETVVERDRGYETLCWVDEAEHNTLSRRRRLLTAVHGATGRASGTCFIHLCERFGEVNRCVRPDHIRVGSVSENVSHHYALRQAAGVPKTMPPEARAKISASMKGRKRTPYGPHSEEHKAKISAAMKGRPKSVETRARMSTAQKGRSR